MLSNVRIPRIKGCYILLNFNAALNLFQLNFDTAIFIRTSLLFFCKFGSSLVVMCFVGFVASSSLELESLKNFRSRNTLSQKEDMGVKVPVAIRRGHEITSFEKL